jgi:hypothetical protein
MEVLPLLQHIRPSYRQRHEYAIVATFNADLRFFEQRVLSNLRARSVLLLMDEGQYHLLTQRDDALSNPRFAGIYYQVEPVAVSHGVFHPKFILCLAEKRSRLVIGSGNMHRQGFMANAEIFSVIESDNDQPDEATTLVSEACDFLQDLTRKDYLSQTAKDFISKALQLQPKIEELPDRQHYFIHSLAKPILEQATSKLNGEKVSEIHVLSPFIHGNDLVEDLLTKFNEAHINVYIQNSRTQFDKESLKTLCHRYSQLNLFEVSVPRGEVSGNTEPLSERYIHGKLLGFVARKSAYSITGSPNFTRAAFRSSENYGNIETALLSRHTTIDFKKLIQNQLLEIQPVISVDSLVPDRLETHDVKGHHHPLRIHSAKYNNSFLAIDFSYQNGNLSELCDFEIAYLNQGKEKYISISLRDANSGHFSLKFELPITATVIWILAKRVADKTPVMSERRWINFPQAGELSETGFNQDDFDRCAEIGGIEGVRQALKIAASFDQPDWLIAFLQTWNLEEIFRANEPQPGGNPPVTLAGHGPTMPLQAKNEYLRKGLATLIRPDFEEVLEDLVQDYREKINEWLEEKEVQSVRMGLQYMLVFDLLNLLLMKGFQPLIKSEFAKMKMGLKPPQMQYGHVRTFAHDFIRNYRYEWEEFLTRGNLALYALDSRKLPPNIYLFHNSRAAIAYTLAKDVSSHIDLEEPVLFDKDITKLIGSYAKEHCLTYLRSLDSVDTLNTVFQSYDLVAKDLGFDWNGEQLRKHFQNIFASA